VKLRSFLIPLLIPLLAFVTAGSTLTMEIVATRLLAPYVGVTLQTYTAIIGTVLAGISVGAFSGGRIADRIGPRRALGPAIVIGAALVLAALPALRFVAKWADGNGSVGAVMLAGGAFLLPAAVLSTVSPMLIKLSMTSLETAGAAVGRIEAAGTAGAIFGTFFAGFVLVAKLPSDVILIAEGISLIAVGLIVHSALNRRVTKGITVAGVCALLAAGATTWRDHKCKYETRYFCVNVSTDENRASGRYLNLDTLSHSYVDLNDPTHLEFEYVQGIVAGINATHPVGPVRALHIGGGGFTVPRYLRATRPGSTNLVIERDAGLVRLDEQLLGLKLGDGLTTIAEDGRVAVRQQSTGDWDVVVGDAFGGEAVPWHLATREFTEQIHARLATGGLYALNVIDSPPTENTPGKFIRSEIATIASVFKHVVVATSDWGWNGVAGDNFVVYASDSALPVAAIQANLAAGSAPWTVHSEVEVTTWVGNSTVLTDRFAPVDQLLTVD
jgi:spermidine synthase